MGRDVEVSCDVCEADLTSTGNCVDYRLVLVSERRASVGGFVTDVAIAPPVDRAYYFCGLWCLAEWISINHPDARDKFKRHIWCRKWRAAGSPHKSTIEYKAFEESLENEGS